MQTRELAAITQPESHDRFVEMLPQIEAFARRAFRKCHRELKDELIAAVVADAFVAFSRLIELGRERDAFPTVLAGYAVRRIGSGICVGGSRNQDDLGSRYCELRTGAQLQRLHWREADDNHWRDLLVEDGRRGSPAEVAALRVDIEGWLDTLSIRDRAIALLLAVGERTCDVAQRLGLTAGRVSQLRRTLAKSWAAFHGFDTSEREFAWLGQCAGV